MTKRQRESSFTKREGLPFTEDLTQEQNAVFPFAGEYALFCRYHNRFRPTYKIAFKTVTELEWRCCPGYQGPDCKNLKPAPDRQIVQGTQPYHPPNPGYSPRHTQSKSVVVPEIRFIATSGYFSPFLLQNEMIICLSLLLKVKQLIL